MARSLVLFDIDGTLIDSAGAGRRALLDAFERVFRPDSLEGASAVRFAGMTDRRILEAMAEASGLDPERTRSEWSRLEQTYVDALRTELARSDGRRRVLPGVRPLLDALSQNGEVCLGLLTGNIEQGARAKLEPFDLNRYFLGGGFGSDHADRREVARIARERMAALDGTPFEPGEVTVIGDTDADVDCARANGFRALAVDTGWAAPGSLQRARPDALFPDLADTPAVLAAIGLA